MYSLRTERFAAAKGLFSFRIIREALEEKLLDPHPLNPSPPSKREVSITFATLYIYILVIVLFPLPRFFWSMRISSAIFCFSASRASSIFAWWIVWSSRALEGGLKKKKKNKKRKKNPLNAVYWSTISCCCHFKDSQSRIKFILDICYMNMKTFIFKLRVFWFCLDIVMLKKALELKIKLKKIKSYLLQQSDIYEHQTKSSHYLY